MLIYVKIFLDRVSNYFIIMSMNIQELLTIDDLSAYLQVSRRTIYEWLKHNKIPALKLVGQWRFQKDKIDLWIQQQTHG